MIRIIKNKIYKIIENLSKFRSLKITYNIDIDIIVFKKYLKNKLKYNFTGS